MDGRSLIHFCNCWPGDADEPPDATPDLCPVHRGDALLSALEREETIGRELSGALRAAEELRGLLKQQQSRAVAAENENDRLMGVLKEHNDRVMRKRERKRRRTA